MWTWRNKVTKLIHFLKSRELWVVNSRSKLRKDVRSTILLTLKRITLTIRESHKLFRRKALQPLEISTLKMIEYYLEKIKIWMKSGAKKEIWSSLGSKHWSTLGVIQVSIGTWRTNPSVNQHLDVKLQLSLTRLLVLHVFEWLF